MSFSKPEYTEKTLKTLKKARRYLKQYHPAVWKSIDHNDSGYAIILAAMECYNKNRRG